VLAVYCPIGILIQASISASLFGGATALWFLSSAIGMVSLAAFIAAARAATCRHREPRPLAVLASYAVASTAQSVTFGFASVLLGAASNPHMSLRLTGLLFQVPLLAAVAYAVSRHDAHRRILTELQRTRDRLLVIGERIDVELDRVETDLARAVRESLEPAVASMEASLADAAAGGQRVDVISAIDSLVEEQVRPLAHQLVAGGEEPSPLTESAVRLPVRVPVPARFRLGDAVKPGFVAAVVVIGALATAIRDLSPLEVPVYLATVSFCTWGLLTLGKRALGSVQVWTALGLPAVVCLYAATGSLAYWIAAVVGVARPAAIAAAAPLFLGLLGFAIAADLLVQSFRARSEAELAAETLSLERAVALIRRRERLVRRRLAFVVHGALQGALHAAALRLAEAEVVSEQLGQEIRRELSAALSQVDGRPEAPGSVRTATTISELSAVWSSHRRFSARLGPSVEEALSGDSDVDEAVAEVLREAANNAFRHGAANAVDVEVTITASSLSEHASQLAISVRDDGSRNSEVSEPGFGSILFDDLCRTWELETDGRGTTFQALIALDS
jgi:signal transduction histidine kinase